MAMTLDARITVPLSILMFLFALVVFLATPAAEVVRNKPVLTIFRTPKGDFFSADRLERAWVHYGLLHAVPATGTIYERKHRICGYTAFSCSLILSISGVLFIPFNLSWSNPMFEMHKVYGIPLIPSSNIGLATIAFPAMMITGFRALYLARQKRFAEHRRWTTYHGISGYLISIERVNILITFAFGYIINASKNLQAALGSSRLNSIPQKAEAEIAAFALTVWAAIFMSAGWALYLKRANVISSKVKST